MRGVTDMHKGTSRGFDAFSYQRTPLTIDVNCQDQIFSQTLFLVAIPKFSFHGVFSVLSFVMNTTLPAVHKESFALLE